MWNTQVCGFRGAPSGTLKAAGLSSAEHRKKEKKSINLPLPFSLSLSLLGPSAAAAATASPAAGPAPPDTAPLPTPAPGASFATPAPPAPRPPPPPAGLPVRAGAARPALGSPAVDAAPRNDDVEVGGGGEASSAAPSTSSASASAHLDECGGALPHAAAASASFAATLATLLALQLGWGLWLMPAALARLGWLPGLGAIVGVGAATAYSASLFSRLAAAVPTAALLSDVAAAARGAPGRALTTAIICTLDGLRCIILAQAGARSLAHAAGSGGRGGGHVHGHGAASWAAGGPRAGAAVALTVWTLAQARGLADVSWFLTAGTVAQLGAIGVVVATLLRSPDPAASTRLVNWGCDPVDGAIALLNVFFAFGGQVRYIDAERRGARPHSHPPVSKASPLLHHLSPPFTPLSLPTLKSSSPCARRPPSRAPPPHPSP